MRTFWYLRLLGPPGLLKNVTTLISEQWILMGKNPRYKLKHPYSIWPPQDTPGLPKIQSNTLYKFPLSPRNSLHHSQSLPRQSERLLFGQGWSEGLWAKWCCHMIYVECQGCLWVPLEMHWVCLCWYGGVWAYFGVSGGCQTVYGWFDWYFGGVFHSLPINIHDSLIRAVTFFNRPVGPRSLKYQNVRT